ncbi:MAG: glycerophosphodiester phosphodiesterase family protein [Candidatus Ratteibacteria bacterium]
MPAIRPLLVVAHRGLSSLYPENTLIAFEKAIDLDIDMIELDVRLTKDKKIVVFHDAELHRLTKGSGAISDYTYAELKKFPIKTKRERMAVQHIPLLEEVFEVYGSQGRWRIEIKQEGLEEDLISLIRKYRLEEEVVLISFLLQSLLVARDKAPEIPNGYISGTFSPDMIPMLVKERISLFDLAHPYVTKDVVRTCHRRGIGVLAWTVDEREQMEEMMICGVDGITTNRPHILKRILSPRRKSTRNVIQRPSS